MKGRKAQPRVAEKSKSLAREEAKENFTAFRRDFFLGNVFRENANDPGAGPPKAQAGLESSPGGGVKERKSALLDAAQVYLEDNGVVTSKGTLPKESTKFIQDASVMQASVDNCRQLFLTAQDLVQKKTEELQQRQLQRALKGSEVRHFTFADYEKYVRQFREENPPEIGEANLVPILAILEGNLAALRNCHGVPEKMKTLRKVKNIGGYLVEVESDDDFGLDDVGPIQRTRNAGSQTDQYPEGSVLAELYQCRMDNNLIIRSLKEKADRNTELEMFLDTVEKRLPAMKQALLEMYSAKEKEMNFLSSMLAESIAENKTLMKRVEALLNSSDLATRRKMQKTFTDQIASLTERIREMQRKCETAERSLMRSEEEKVFVYTACEQTIHAIKEAAIPPEVQRALGDLHIFTVMTDSGEKGGQALAKCRKLVSAAFQRSSSNTSNLNLQVEELLHISVEDCLGRLDAAAVQPLRNLNPLLSFAADPIGSQRALFALQNGVTEVRKAFEQHITEAYNAIGDYVRKVDALAQQRVERVAEEGIQQKIELENSLRTEIERLQQDLHHEQEKARASVKPNRFASQRQASTQTVPVRLSSKRLSTATDDSNLSDGNESEKEGKKKSSAADKANKSNHVPFFNPFQFPPHLPYDQPADVLQFILGYLSELIAEVCMFSTHFGSRIPSRVRTIQQIFAIIKHLQVKLRDKKSLVSNASFSSPLSGSSKASFTTEEWLEGVEDQVHRMSAVVSGNALKSEERAKTLAEIQKVLGDFASAHEHEKYTNVLKESMTEPKKKKAPSAAALDTLALSQGNGDGAPTIQLQEGDARSSEGESDLEGDQDDGGPLNMDISLASTSLLTPTSATKRKTKGKKRSPSIKRKNAGDATPRSPGNLAASPTTGASSRTPKETSLQGQSRSKSGLKSPAPMSLSMVRSPMSESNIVPMVGSSSSIFASAGIAAAASGASQPALGSNPSASGADLQLSSPSATSRSGTRRVSLKLNNSVAFSTPIGSKLKRSSEVGSSGTTTNPSLSLRSQPDGLRSGDEQLGQWDQEPHSGNTPLSPFFTPQTPVQGQIPVAGKPTQSGTPQQQRSETYEIKSPQTGEILQVSGPPALHARKATLPEGSPLIFSTREKAPEDFSSEESKSMSVEALDETSHPLSNSVEGEGVDQGRGLAGADVDSNPESVIRVDSLVSMNSDPQSSAMLSRHSSTGRVKSTGKDSEGEEGNSARGRGASGKRIKSLPPKKQAAGHSRSPSKKSISQREKSQTDGPVAHSASTSNDDSLASVAAAEAQEASLALKKELKSELQYLATELVTLGIDTASTPDVLSGGDDTTPDAVLALLQSYATQVRSALKTLATQKKDPAPIPTDPMLMRLPGHFKQTQKPAQRISATQLALDTTNSKRAPVLAGESTAEADIDISRELRTINLQRLLHTNQMAKARQVQHDQHWRKEHSNSPPPLVNPMEATAGSGRGIATATGTGTIPRGSPALLPAIEAPSPNSTFGPGGLPRIIGTATTDYNGTLGSMGEGTLPAGVGRGGLPIEGGTALTPPLTAPIKNRPQRSVADQRRDQQHSRLQQQGPQHGPPAETGAKNSVDSKNWFTKYAPSLLDGEEDPSLLLGGGNDPTTAKSNGVKGRKIKEIYTVTAHRK